MDEPLTTQSDASPIIHYIYNTVGESNTLNPDAPGIPLVKDYLLKRNDILFPINDMICALIGSCVFYLCEQIVECSENYNYRTLNAHLIPMHIFKAVNWDDELSITFKPTLLQIMHPIITKTFELFYHFMDQKHSNRINFEQFWDGITKIGINTSDVTLKEIFDEIDLNQTQSITIEEWTQYFNEHIECTGDAFKDTLKGLIVKKTASIFDILNANNVDPILNESITQIDSFRQTSSIENEIEQRIQVTRNNIHKYIASQTNPNIYEHKQKENNKASNEDTAQYILNEYALYPIIFGYLAYEDILNNVYQMDGILHEISVPVLNETYSEYIYCRFLNDSIHQVMHWVSAERTKISKDGMLILNVLLMTVMNRIIDQINLVYSQKKKTNSIHEFAIQDMKQIFTNAKIAPIMMHCACKMVLKAFKSMNDQYDHVYDLKRMFIV
eukprot:301357_1